MHRRIWAALAVVLALVAVLVFVSEAHGYPDGQYPQSALKPIYNPSVPNFLTPGPAADWNVMFNCASHDGVDLYSAGGAAAYRREGVPADYPPPVYGTQWYFWGAHFHGGALAAYPGTSNHGAPGGRGAVDLGNPASMRPWIDRHGSAYGWTWGEVPRENWHITHWSSNSVTDIPDPGPSIRFPVLRKGSRGKCLAPAIHELQRRLGVKQSDTFGPGTERHLVVWQKANISKHSGTGVAGHTTWIKIREQRGIPHPNYVRLTSPVRMRGKDVLAVQGKLNARRHEVHKPPVKVDGNWGQEDNAALKNFQRSRHLDDSGVAGPKTLKALATPAKKVQKVTAKIAAAAPHEEKPHAHKAASSPCAKYANWIKRSACVVRVARTKYLRRDVYAKKQHGAKRAKWLKLRAGAREQYNRAKARLRAIPTKITAAGVRLVASFEGLYHRAYNDGATAAGGYCTIGYGRLLHYSLCNAADRLLYWSTDKALAELGHDLTNATKSVLAVLSTSCRTWTQGMVDGSVSFIFNLGPGVLDRGRSFGDALRRCNRAAAAKAMLLYDKAGGRVLLGLTRRRHAEAALLLR